MISTPTQTLTDRQRAVLGFIAQRIAEGLPPTNREIAARFRFVSVNAAVKHLSTLERKRCVTVYRKHARGIRLTPLGHATVAGLLPSFDAREHLREIAERIEAGESTDRDAEFLRAISQ